ncbi:uncharacterized protein PAC_02711 [Phialocephala subalpina]|uniref:Uncharacterized protein n=1 Tax=Phialocephala subalpina TaxID=576137 RepID=A0A1L7WJ85_9HELO|nr:uncharacterized protein PAC_02711 [Phialocephala subalpina]
MHLKRQGPGVHEMLYQWLQTSINGYKDCSDGCEDLQFLTRTKKSNKKIRALEKYIEKLSRKNTELKKGNKNAISNLENLHEKIATLQIRDTGHLERIRELENLTRMIICLKHITKIESLQERVKQLTREKQEMEEQIRTAQRERTIQGNIMDLHGEVKEWAKSWGRISFSVIDHSNLEKREEALDQLAAVVVLENGHILLALRTEEMSTKASVLCVSAVLAQYVYSKALGAPFRPRRQLATGQMVCKNVNESKVQVWRRDMMLILDPSSFEGASPAELRAQEDVAKRRTQAASSLTSAFLNEKMGCLLPILEPVEAASRHKQLQPTFQSLEVEWKDLWERRAE